MSASARASSEPPPTKKVGYNPAEDIKRGICALEGCKKKAAVIPKEKGPFMCDDHEETRTRGYGYIGHRSQFIQQYNAEVQFSQSVQSAHAVVHHDAEKTCRGGQCGKGTMHYQDCARDYGGWNLKEPYLTPAKWR